MYVVPAYRGTGVARELLRASRDAPATVAFKALA
jgi:hypothetical protein